MGNYLSLGLRSPSRQSPSTCPDTAGRHRKLGEHSCAITPIRSRLLISVTPTVTQDKKRKQASKRQRWHHAASSDRVLDLLQRDAHSSGIEQGHFDTPGHPAI